MARAAEPGRAIEGRASIRVRYSETDRMDVAYHAHYLTWFEVGRTELLRGLGSSYAALEDRGGIRLPLVEVGARYRVPARYDDRLAVETRVAAVGGARVRFEYRVVREADGSLIATGFSVHGSVGRDGRPRRLPAGLRQRLVEGGAG